MIELCLLDVKMYSWAPSVQAAAAIYTVNKILKRSPSWPVELLECTGYQEKEVVKACAKDICKLMNEACSTEKAGFKELIKKFSNAKFMEVS